MEQTVKLKGHTSQPSDYLCPDGELAVCINAVPENGSIKPVEQPEIILENNIGDPADIIYTHRVDGHENLIFGISGSGQYVLYYLVDYRNYNSLGEASPRFLQIHSFDKKISGCRSVGNILVISTGEGIVYARWMHDGYTYLGVMPELPEIEFGLDLHIAADDERFQFHWTETSRFEHGEGADSAMMQGRKDNYNKILGYANKLIALNEDKFCFPFFVRYAYRLYDGTITKHSAPILMTPATACNPYFTIFNTDSGTVTNGVPNLWPGTHTLSVRLITSVLTYRILSHSELLDGWKDIISGIDVYISAPFYTFDQDPDLRVESPHVMGVGDSAQNPDNPFSSLRAYTVGNRPRIQRDVPEPVIDRLGGTAKTKNDYRVRDMRDMIVTEAISDGHGGVTVPAEKNFLFPIPKEHKKFVSEIKGCSNFYKYAEIDLKKVLDNSNSPDIAEDSDFKKLECMYPGFKMNNIYTYPVMTDDPLSHIEVFGKSVMMYNNRLHVGNLTKRMFEGFSLPQSLQHTSLYNGMTCDIYVFIRKNYAEYTVVKYSSMFQKYAIMHRLDGEKSCSIPYFFYPDPDAYKVEIVPYDSGYPHLSFDLTRHEFIPGACFFSNFEDSNIAEPVPGKKPVIRNTYTSANQCYVSEVNNPFVFNPQYQFTVGNGEILGLSSAAKAVSQGQFGQFPLYAFTTEGVWALGVSDKGTYITRSPFTRDVCVEPDSITQLDGEVAFFTHRGIILLSGSTSTCISNVINKPEDNSQANPGCIGNLPKILDLARKSLGQAELKDITVRPFLKFIVPNQSRENAGMLYDYLNQRLLVFNSGAPYMYVFSLESKQWGMLGSTIAYTVNSYPDALGIDEHGTILNFATKAGGDGSDSQFIITRPFKFDSQDTYKTIRSLYLRGYFNPSHIHFLALYGSSDGRHFVPVRGSSDYFINGFSGTPYRCFVLAMGMHLYEGESVTALSMDVVGKLSNRIR